MSVELWDISMSIKIQEDFINTYELYRITSTLGNFNWVLLKSTDGVNYDPLFETVNPTT